MKFLMIGAAAALISMGSVASASIFTIVGGAPDSVPGGIEGDEIVTPQNNVIDALSIGTFNPVLNRFELDGFSNGISIAMNRSARVKVELLGFEAGFFNSFTLDGNTVGKGINGVGSTQTVIADSLDSFVTDIISSLDFVFASGNAAGLNNKGGVANGDANPIPGQNFFASCVGNPGARNCNTMYIMYDDEGQINDNHDDLVIRISAIPLPAGMVLMLTGLGALALRRRKAA